MQTRRPPRLRLTLLSCLLLLLAAPPLDARQQQQRCTPSAIAQTAHAESIFTPRQEMDLGDVIAEQAQRDYRIVEDDEVTGYLRRVGARLVEQLPPSEMRYRFFVVDLPDANAFTMPGGRIYVTRKLIAFAASEDELAGVLAHELGHAASGQIGAEMTQLFQKVLGVTQVGDRRDIFEKYNQLLDNAARKPGAWNHGDREEEGNQFEADRIGIYAMAAAGYDPQAFASLWDRLAETKGKTGGWLSDLFGTTKPDEKRLRLIRKELQTLPADCASKRAPASPDEFKKWQAAVVSYGAGAGRKESLHDVLSQTRLEPPLQDDINFLRFSPDGKYIIAQDDSGITVLSHEPLAPLFRIEAPEARPAQFTPDSRSVVFHNSDLRVESWDVEAKKQTSAREMYVHDGCIQTELSPDGRTLACLETNSALTLYDVETGAQLFQKKDFYKPDITDFFRTILLALVRAGDGDLDDFGERAEFVSMRFSPDAHYFAAGQRSVSFTAMATISADNSAVIYDLNAKSAVPAKGLLKKLLAGKFDFVAPDRVIAVNPEDFNKSAIATFPAGEVVEQFPLTGSPYSPTKGNYVMLRPIANFAVGLMDLSSKKIFIASKSDALDVYGDTYVSERINGEVALYHVGNLVAFAKIIMPRSTLGRLRAVAVSPDLKWLAVSQRSRGAVWDLAKGERVFHVRGFRGAYFGDDGALYADFPKFEQTERTIARLDIAHRSSSAQSKVSDEGRVTQRGTFIITQKPAKKGGDLDRNVTLALSDTRAGTEFWSRTFPKEAPRVFVEENEGTLVLTWDARSEHAKSEIKSDPKLSQRFAAMKEKEGNYFVQAVDARAGKSSGALLVETGKGSFRITDAFAAGDWLVISDTSNRVLLYSISTGEQKGKFFGRTPAISKEAGLLAVETERGQLTVFDLASSEKRDQFTFSGPVSLARFSSDGKRLFVLTADQTAYVLDLAQTAQTH
jgi:WD40 repeat protein